MKPPNKTLQLTAQSAAALWVPSALRAPAATELRRWALQKGFGGMLERQSPYLDRPGRLADLVAAIQALGSYRYAARKEEKWQQLLKKPKSAESWTEIFRDHPEFFRASESDSGMHQLVLRRAQSAMAHATTAESINIEAYKALSDDDKKEYSRAPLNPEQIISLIDVAIKLQNQAVARRQELRWWIPYLLSIASLVVGVVTGISIK